MLDGSLQAGDRLLGIIELGNFERFSTRQSVSVE
jgi:hypothetical protein